MADYQRMYLRLVDAVEQTLDVMDSARDREQKERLTETLLVTGLQDCEDIYVETAE